MKTLEQAIKEALSLSVTPSNSEESIEWHNETTAENDFYEYIWNGSNFYGSCEHASRLRTAHSFIKEQLSMALVSASPYVRKLAYLISKENDREWLKQSYIEYLRRSTTLSLKKEDVLLDEEIELFVNDIVEAATLSNSHLWTS